MYDFLDRPVESLPPFERAVLAATRRWVHALTVAGTMPPPERDQAFHQVMHLLEQHSSDMLVLQRPCHRVVEETEALLLCLWRLARTDRIVPAHQLASALVNDCAVRPLVHAMMDAVAEFD